MSNDNVSSGRNKNDSAVDQGVVGVAALANNNNNNSNTNDNDNDNSPVVVGPLSVGGVSATVEGSVIDATTILLLLLPIR